MSKYEPLWRFLECDGSECYRLSFDRIEEIIGFPLDQSFSEYLHEAELVGYHVDKVSQKYHWVQISRIL